MCMNLWPVSHTSSSPMDKARFLHTLLHGDSKDLPTFIWHQIVHTFHMICTRIGLPYVSLIYRLVMGLPARFLDRITGGFSSCSDHRSHSRSHVSLSFAPIEPVNPIVPTDLTIPTDPTSDLLYVDPSDILHSPPLKFVLLLLIFCRFLPQFLFHYHLVILFHHIPLSHRPVCSSSRRDVCWSSSKLIWWLRLQSWKPLLSAI